MRKLYFMSVFIFCSGCAFAWGIPGLNFGNTKKKTVIAGVAVEKQSIKGVEKVEAKADVKATVKAQGADLSKKEEIGGDKIVTTSNDSKMIMYIFGAIIGIMQLLIINMFKQLKMKDKIIHDLGNDSKDIYPYFTKIIDTLLDMIKEMQKNN